MGTTLSALLVDDEPTASQVLRKLLAVHPHIQAIGAATSVADARNFLQQQPADVVFLDVEMPSGLGLELLQHLDPTVKVVFVTASESYAVKAFNAGAVDYLVKPIDPERLADTVQRLTQNLPPDDEPLGNESVPAPLDGKWLRQGYPSSDLEVRRYRDARC